MNKCSLSTTVGFHTVLTIFDCSLGMFQKRRYRKAERGEKTTQTRKLPIVVDLIYFVHTFISTLRMKCKDLTFIVRVFIPSNSLIYGQIPAKLINLPSASDAQIPTCACKYGPTAVLLCIDVAATFLSSMLSTFDCTNRVLNEAVLYDDGVDGVEGLIVSTTRKLRVAVLPIGAALS